jgi:hypothetical protein
VRLISSTLSYASTTRPPSRPQSAAATDGCMR